VPHKGESVKKRHTHEMAQLVVCDGVQVCWCVCDQVLRGTRMS
jgi:hypothetical protein